ncbi:MAG: MGMT family protein [Opitutaceae bacterium]|nr:MGMT family protein [Opitutaceae bacterium]
MPRATFPTALGRCAITWHEGGLTSFSLPEALPRSDDTAEAPPEIAALITRAQRHLAGQPEDFADLNYDFSEVGEFHRRVLRATLAVKSGRTATYGEIAAAIGEPPAASRAVGAALGANRWPLLIPCHRVTGADGRMTGFSGPGGIETKTRLLAIEGACLL